MTVQQKPLITAKEAETEIPDLEAMFLPDNLRRYLETRLNNPPENDANLLIEGDPGTGKTSVEIALIRRRLNNPKLFSGDFEEIVQEPGNEALNEYDARFFQTKTYGGIYVFVRIDGGSEKRVCLEEKVQDVIWSQGDHKFVLLDEAGELFFRGMEECLRPLLTHPRVTTYANAQNFHSKRRTDKKAEEEARLIAFLRRFTHRFHMTNPTPDQLTRLLIRRMKHWRIELDHPSTLRLLVEKSECVVGYAIRPLIRAIDDPDGRRMLTRRIVEEADVNPLLG